MPAFQWMTITISVHLHYINYLNCKRLRGPFAMNHAASMPDIPHPPFQQASLCRQEFVGVQRQFANPNTHPLPSAIHNILAIQYQSGEVITLPLQFQLNARYIIDNQSMSFHSYLPGSFLW